MQGPSLCLARFDLARDSIQEATIVCFPLSKRRLRHKFFLHETFKKLSYEPLFQARVKGCYSFTVKFVGSLSPVKSVEYGL
jgi:hypothetical protein